MMKSKIQIGKLLKVQISSSMAKIFLSSSLRGNVFSSAWKSQPYHPTPILSHFFTFLDFHHVIIVHTSFNIHRIQDTQRTTHNGQTCLLAWPRPSKNNKNKEFEGTPVLCCLYYGVGLTFKSCISLAHGVNIFEKKGSQGVPVMVCEP